jgi:hypothetical protein
MATRYWVGGTGNWSNTARWSTASGGVGGASVPGSGDAVIFNGSSAGGTATVDSNVTVQTLTMTGYGGTLAFGTNTISLNGTGTVFTGATTCSISGTPVINLTYTGIFSMTVLPGAVTEANSISFNFTGGTYTLSFLTTASHAARNVDFTGYAGAIVGFSTCFIYGDLTFSTGMSTSGGSNITFAATSGTKVITSNGQSLDSPVTFNGVGGTWRLADALTVGPNARITTLTNGTLDLNGKTLTTGFFASSNSNTRTIAFGSGNIVCNVSSGGTAWTTATTTGLTITGTPTVNISNSGAVATTVASGILTEANAISFNFTTGTYALTFLATASYSAKNVSFAGFAGTWGTTSTGIVYGNLTLSTGMTLTASASALRFGATSGTQVITTNAKTIDFPLTVNGIGGTVQLADALTMGATRTLTLNNGTFDAANKTVSGMTAISSNLASGNITIKNLSTSVNYVVNYPTINVTLGTNISVGVVTLTAGTINLATYSLTCTSFSSSGSIGRSIAFGTGNITITGSGTVWNTALNTNLTHTGTSNIIISNNTATATTISTGAGWLEANTLSFNIINGTYTLLLNNSPTFRNLNFVSSGPTGFGGTISGQTSIIQIYGDLTLSSNMTLASVGTYGFSFLKTTGTQTVTSNGVIYNFPLYQDAVGGTMQLADALTMLSTRAFSHNNGTIDLNGKIMTVGTQYLTNAGTKNITFNGGTLVCPAATTTAFNNAVPAGFTTTAGTGTGKISMTAAAAKTFVGGGSTYNCTLSNDGAGALTISGSNTFTTIENTVQPTAFTFTATTTQTVTNWNVSGTAGNLVTITSGTAGTAATLSKSSGTVSSNYLSLKDSAATGGASWYAGANSTNVSGNSGWIFSAPPVVTAGGNFFFMF